MDTTNETVIPGKTKLQKHVLRPAIAAFCTQIGPRNMIDRYYIKMSFVYQYRAQRLDLHRSINLVIMVFENGNSINVILKLRPVY